MQQLIKAIETGTKCTRVSQKVQTKKIHVGHNTFWLFWSKALLRTKNLEFSSMHCNPVQDQNRARTGFSQCSNSHRENHVFITGNPFSHCRDPVFITGIFLWELLHREIPVVITGNGFAVCFHLAQALQRFCTHCTISSIVKYRLSTQTCIVF